MENNESNFYADLFFKVGMEFLKRRDHIETKTDIKIPFRPVNNFPKLLNKSKID